MTRQSMQRTTIGFCMLAIAAVLLPGAAVADDQPVAGDCRLTPYASFDISPDVRDALVVPVKLDGQEMLLSLSTGSPRSALNESTVEQLGLARTAMGFAGRHHGVKTEGLWMGRKYVNMQGEKVDEMTYVPSFDLGGMTGKNLRFAIFPNTESEKPIAGALGADILSQYDVELDFAAGKVRLYSHTHCPGKVIYWTREPYASARFHLDGALHMVIPVELDGVPLIATVATGVTYPIMNLGTARSVFGWRSDPAELKADPERMGDFDYPFKKLGFAGASVHDPIVKLSDEDLHMKGDMILGLSALRAFHIYISYKEETIYLTARDAH